VQTFQDSLYFFLVMTHWRNI